MSLITVCLGTNHAQLRDEEPGQTSDLAERIPGHVNPVPVLPLSQRHGESIGFYLSWKLYFQSKTI